MVRSRTSIGHDYVFSFDSATSHADLDAKLAIVHGAAFASYVNQHKDECLPVTRTSSIRLENGLCHHIH